jgi:hypothetical protein
MFLRDFLARVDGVDLSDGVHTFSANGGASSSLLDRFIVPRPISDRVVKYEVRKAKLQRFSDHHPVHLVIAIPMTLPKRPKKWQWTQRKFIIPTDPQQRQTAHDTANVSFAAIEEKEGILRDLHACSTSDQLEKASLRFAKALTTASKQSFRLTQGSRNRRPFRSRQIVQLNSLKLNLVHYIRQTLYPLRPQNATLFRAITKGARLLLPRFPLPPTHGGKAAEVWARQLLKHIRRRIKATYKDFRRINWDAFVKAPRVSEFASKIAKKSRPPPVTSVRDPATGQLTADPEVVKRQLLLRVTEPMRRPEAGPMCLPSDPTPADTPLPGLPDWYQDIYTPINVNGAWGGLCEAPTWKELREVVGKAKKHTSPGEGALGIDLIQCCLDWSIPFNTVGSGDPPGPIAQALLAYLAAVFRVGVYPEWTCTAWITTIDKGSANPLDVRPISVLPELYRLISRILNARLLAVFREHKILHTAQRAGLTDGDFLQCLDVVTSMIEDAKLTGDLALVLYDQSKAFDLVTPAAITRACRRLGLPDKFISLIVSAILRAKARVRTAFGLSGVVTLSRSLRQGDPLASILYCIYIDPLHQLLQRIGGYRFSDTRTVIASAAFMDDTAVAANSYQELIPLHHAVVGFSLLNDGLLNNTKSLLFLRDHEGPLEWRALYTPTGPIMPVSAPADKAHRYLGLWINLELSWKEMDDRIKRTFWRIFFCIKNNHLPLKAAKLVSDLWLLPVFRQSLRLSRFTTDPAAVMMLQDLQKALNSLVAKNAGCPHPRNWSGPIASVLFNTKDMAQHALALNIEALHLNLNLPTDLFPSAAATRARLASFVRSQDPTFPPLVHLDDNRLLSKIEAMPPKAFRASVTTECDIAAKLGLAMAQGLRFLHNPRHSRSIAFQPSILPGPRFGELLHRPEGGAHPTIDLMRTLLFNEPPAVWDIFAYELEWLRDLVEVPAALAPARLISVYTDGSAKLLEDAGAAAIFTLGDRKLLTVRTRLRASRKSFLPECVGCLLAARFTPLNVGAEVICDCRSALFVAPRPAVDISWKKRLTSAARPVLECIRAILPLRSEVMDWRWVRAHTAFPAKDVDTFFNNEVDRQAKAARGLLPMPPASLRTWRWGAEQAMLATLSYPSMDPPSHTPSAPRQVMGSVKGFLDRLQKVNLAKCAARSKTMGKSLRYNGNQVVRIVHQLSKFASSGTHARVAMALASYLPLANRSTWSTELDTKRGSCEWCASGLKQDSPHIFNCPRLIWNTSRVFKQQFNALVHSTRLLPSALKGTVDRVAHGVDVIRDCLALHLMGRTSELGSVPLGLGTIQALPHAVMLLSAAFAERAFPLSRSQGDEPQGGIRVCVADAWDRWVASFRLLIANTNLMEPDPYNSAPLPAVWEALQNPALPSSFHAVVFEGTPALPPPSDIVWYSASSATPGTAWWAQPLPEVGPSLRVFEWAPLASRLFLDSRKQWWAEAVSAAASSIIWAVVPDDFDACSLSTNHNLVCLASHSFPLQVARPQDPQNFWFPAVAGLIWVRSVLVFSALLPLHLQIAWSEVASSLPDLLRGLKRPLRTSTDPRLSYVPANWWWGPPPRTLSTSTMVRSIPLTLRSPSKCRGGALCRATCSSALQLTNTSRFLGNLGVPPRIVTNLFAEAGPAFLEGDREPPRWISISWCSLERLLRAARRLP